MYYTLKDGIRTPVGTGSELYLEVWHKYSSRYCVLYLEGWFKNPSRYYVLYLEGWYKYSSRYWKSTGKDGEEERRKNVHGKIYKNTLNQIIFHLVNV